MIAMRRKKFSWTNQLIFDVFSNILSIQFLFIRAVFYEQNQQEIIGMDIRPIMRPAIHHWTLFSKWPRKRLTNPTWVSSIGNVLMSIFRFHIQLKIEWKFFLNECSFLSNWFDLTARSVWVFFISSQLIIEFSLKGQVSDMSYSH